MFVERSSRGRGQRKRGRVGQASRRGTLRRDRLAGGTLGLIEGKKETDRSKISGKFTVKENLRGGREDGDTGDVIERL